MQNSSINKPASKNVSPDDVLNFTGFGPFQVIAFILSGLTYFAFGCDGSVYVFMGDSVRKEFNITETEYALLPGSTAAPNILGAIVFSILSDRFGRWWPYIVVMTWMGVFSIASAWAPSFGVLIALRCGTSFAIGGITCLVMPTIIEFLPVKS